jgi:hypothetical protein
VQVSHRRGRNIEILAGASLLALGVACQFVADVSDYRFEGRDAGGTVGALEPPPVMRSLDDDPPGASNAPATPRADADDNTAPEPPENTPERPSTDAGAIPVESDAEPPPSEPPPSEPPPTEPPPSEPPPTEPPPSEPPPPDPTFGCSYIEFCYAYEVIDTTDEERCIQSGCTLDDAETECRAEIAEVCGIAPQPPFVLFTLDNERVILN